MPLHCVAPCEAILACLASSIAGRAVAVVLRLARLYRIARLAFVAASFRVGALGWRAAPLSAHSAKHSLC